MSGRDKEDSKSKDLSSSVVPSSTGSFVSRGRQRARRPNTPPDLEKRGYHSFSCLGRIFHVEKRWKLVRELGQGAYGLVVSAQDGISGETVAIKLVTRIFEKLQLAKRALREIALLRHFQNHENITGIIDIDIISPDFNEIYLYMEPMEADLYQIIRSGQQITNAHVQYFIYQVLRGMKYIHTAHVVHRDLKPGNLLVNSDCELKICDLGLSRGYDARADEENATHMTEYVATRWYRAPEVMLSFRSYNTAIDVWSIGCILGELLGCKPMFKGKDYVDQLNQILNILGTPEERSIQRIGSEKAQAYIRSLPLKKQIPFVKLYPHADPLALDLLAKMVAFDPSDRISVIEALEHPYLASYHEVGDEPSCPEPFEKWREIEELDTIEQFRVAIAREVAEFRREVRTIDVEEDVEIAELLLQEDVIPEQEEISEAAEVLDSGAGVQGVPFPTVPEEAPIELPPGPAPRNVLRSDPFATYRRRSILSASAFRFTSANVPEHALESANSSVSGHQRAVSAAGYFTPARSRAPSTGGGEGRPLLRALSTVSINDAVPGGLAALGMTQAGKEVTAADAPPSSLPTEFKESRHPRAKTYG